MRRRLIVVVLGFAAAALTGCVVQSAAAPACDAGADAAGASAAILLAQAVPTADLVPCVDALPTGWRLASSEVDSEGAQLTFAHDREGAGAIVVEVTDSCDVAGASRVPSDEPGTERYELVRDVTGGYAGTRSYRYEGGCTSYVFRLRAAGWSAHLGDMTAALSFRDAGDVRALAAGDER